MWKIQIGLTTVTILNLEYLLQISSIQPIDLQGLSKILPQSAKFLLQACPRPLLSKPISIFFFAAASSSSKHFAAHFTLGTALILGMWP